MSLGRIDRLNLLTILVAAICIAVPLPLFAEEPEIIPIPLYIDKNYSGEIAVTILSDDAVQIRPSELIAYLEDLMSEEAVATAKMIFPENGWINLTGMGELGVRIIFSFEDLTMQVSIPAHLRRETTVSLKGKQHRPAGDYIEKTDFSAFLNLALWNRFTYETLTYDFSATPEIGMNIFDWVIEARGSVQTNGDLFLWDYSRLIKDFPTLGYRLEIGDLTIPVPDLSGVSKLLGASFRKNYNLFPNAETPSPYAKEIFLREPSKVEIYMNNRKIRENDYQSGNYIFQDFPLTRGVNSISIRWEDSEGKHEENMIIPFEGNLLKAGEMDLGIAAGLPDREIVPPSISSYQYMGITNTFTFGIVESLNIDSLELTIHPDFLLSTKFGNFNLVPLWGMDFNGGQKLDARLLYQMLKSGINNNLNFGGDIAYNFNSITDPETPTSQLSLGGYFNFFFGEGFNFTPEAAWSWRFDENRQILNTRAILKKSIRGGSALSANIGLNYDRELSFSATISFSSSFPDLNQNIYLLENLESQQLSAFWSRYSSGDNDFSLNASTELPINPEDKLALGVSGGYQHPLFNINAGHNFDTVIASASSHNATYLSAGSGLLYADGHLMLSKPVNDSFIIIVPGPEFADQTLRVNPGSGGSQLELNGKPGVMANISSFTAHKVYIEPEELPEGMDDAGMKYLTFPSYKSAFVIRPQADILIFIGGYIKTGDGMLIDTALGRLTGNNTGESIDFFTDENGYFEAYSLKPDIYTLQLTGYEATASIDLSGIKSGFHDVGLITITGDE